MSNSRMLVKSAIMPFTADLAADGRSVKFNNSPLTHQRDSTAPKQVTNAIVGVTPCSLAQALKRPNPGLSPRAGARCLSALSVPVRAVADAAIG